MRGPGALRRRSAALVAAITLHAGLLIILVTLRTPAQRPAAAGFVSTLILLTEPTRADPRRERRPPTYELAPVAPAAPVERLITPPAISLQGPPDASIDWSEEARRAASAMAEPRTYREFSHTPKAEAESRRRPAHEAGEQYRLDTGEWVVSVSDRCYLVSGAPPLGLPDVLARSIPTTTVCKDNTPPPGELFRDLPEYQKYHAAPAIR